MPEFKILIENYTRPDQKNQDLTGAEVAFGKRISRRLAMYDEVWIQKLIHDNPETLAVSERLTNLYPLTREFSVSSGRIDNIFVRSDGRLVLVEVKLWRNQESKKKVVDQCQRYYEEFSNISVAEIIRRVKTLNTKGLDKAVSILESDSELMCNEPCA